ncbi:MAG: hypothetical protein FJ034_02540 [Chloroflexi bacterium]|nr:hypothetical protein [Chloroflexota bacterium]
MTALCNMPAFIVPHLQARRVRQKEQQLLAGSRWSNPQGLVFTYGAIEWVPPSTHSFAGYSRPSRRPGGGFSGTDIDRRFRRLADAAGLPEWATPQTLRASAATYLLSQGVPMAEISALLEHTRSATTEKFYARLRHAPTGRVASVMDRRMAGAV